MVGKECTYIIGIWKTKEDQRAFLIPWKKVYIDVCSGERGSIDMLEFQELEKVKGGWNFSFLKSEVTF